MKKIFLTLALASLLSAGNLSAREIDLNEAQQIAMNFAGKQGMRLSKSPMKLLAQEYTATGTAYYVFAPATGNGFTIVSGNDVAEPILGYSDNGIFDPANMPEGLRYMLDCYRKEIENAVANGYTQIENLPERRALADIAPLCLTTWDQDAPYWNLCPTKNGLRCYTGCVATAMAQAVYVFKYPEASKGTATWNYTTVSFDRTYSWDDMLLSYAGNYTTAQGTAVAELMVDLGKSVDMSYGNAYDGGSGAMTDIVPEALVNNFSYDKACAYSQADNWPAQDWIELMYYQISQGWPVIYGGFGTGYNGGHQFICDGYRSGDYFHINWGWSGMSDGYFKLTALKPGSQGAGGNTSDFSTGCDAVYFVRKPVEGSEMQTQVSCRGNFVMGTSTSNGTTFRVTNGTIWTQTCNGFFNAGGFSFTAKMGIRLINKDDTSKVYTVGATSNTTFNKWSNILASYTVRLSDIPDGTYYAFPVSKATTKDYWERVMAPRDKQQYVQLIISNGVATSTTPTTPLYNPVNTLYMPATDSVLVDHNITMTPYIVPSNGTNTALRYSSSNENVATVDSITGVVTGIAIGECYITATTTDGSLISARTKVSVSDDSGVAGIVVDEDAPVDVYTITGVLVARGMKVQDIQNLQPGIYVAGGRKYMVR